MKNLRTSLMPNSELERHILVIEESNLKRTIVLDKPTYSIGRDSSQDIVISSEKVSRHHATFLKRTDMKTKRQSYWILDGNLQGNRSRNGIFINGKKCLVHELKHGDNIDIGGSVTARYQIIANSPEKSEKIITIIPEKKEKKKYISSQQKTIFNKETTIAYRPQLEKIDEYEIVRLRTVAELNPQPIIEIDLQGNITYLNSAARVNFQDIQQQKDRHPILEGLREKYNRGSGNLFTREVVIGDRIFEQKAHYLSENKLIRSYIVEVTEQKKLRAKVQQQEALYRTLLQQIPVGVLFLNSRTKEIVSANEVMCNLLGYAHTELVRLTIDDIAWERETLEANLQRVIANQQNITSVITLSHQNNSLVQVEAKISLVDLEEEPLLMVVCQREKDKLDITAEAITPLPNQLFFQQQLKIAIANSKRNQKLIAVMHLNFENFPQIRQTLDDKLTNRLLYNLADRLRACLRAGDTVAYLGNDKFAVLMPQIGRIEEVAKVGQRIINTLEETFKLGENSLRLKSKIGIAIYPQDGEQVDTLLKNADFALHRSYPNPETSYQFCDSTMDSQAAVILRLERLLQQALEQKEFILHYQPQVNINNGQIQGIEALLRWQHPELGVVSPASFIKLAEQTGLIIPIGEWVLKTACHQNKLWQAQGLPPIRISVNLSGVQLQQPNLPSLIAKVLAETELEPHLLELEIAAVSLMKQKEYSLRILRDLQSVGVYICIDDFASGFTSLNYLKQFPFQTLKIDRTFIQDLSNTPQNLAIVSALVSLGKGFNLRVVAEGVETQQQIELLRSLECEQMQGFWFSRPLTAEDATKLLPFDLEG